MHDQFSAVAQFCADCGFEFAGLLCPLIAQFRRTPSRIEMKSSIEGFLPGRQPVQKPRRETGLLPAEHAFFAGQRKLSPIVRFQYDDGWQRLTPLIALTGVPPRFLAHALDYPIDPSAGPREP